MSISAEDQAIRAQRLKELHAGTETFVIANVWDGGSARLLQSLGFPALATSSGAAAAVLGRKDGEMRREEALVQARIIVAATSCPVSADLENGFGDAPEEVARTIRAAAEAGLVGGSIEDATGDPAAPSYALSHAVERVTAAVEAARQLPFPFAVTARCEHFVNGRPDLAATIERLQAFERAGADVLFAPGLPDLASVQAVCAALVKPVNFMVGIRGRSFSVPELAAAGVRRISLSTSLYRAAVTGLAHAAHEVRDSGTFTYLEHILSTAELNAYLGRS
jgi:2-methylisocitrate lyase-like PEP mutase family enzyme